MNEKITIGAQRWNEIITSGVKTFGPELSRDQLNSFSLHAKTLLEWNRKMNITAIKDPFEMAVKHFIDSVAPARLLPKDASILDVGSGGGFPGIPLKIAVPSLNVILLDASGKKVTFLNYLIRELKLKNIRAVKGRVESFSHPEKFGYIVSRAFSSLDFFVKAALPLLGENGSILAMKGKLKPEEMEKLKQATLEMGLSQKDIFIKIEKYTLPFVNAERSVVQIQCQRPHVLH